MPPVVAAALVVFFEGLVLWAIFPTAYYYCRELTDGALPDHRLGLAVGLIFMLQGGPKVFFNPLFGRLSDHIGRRPVLALSCAGTLAASVAWALAPNIAWLLVSRAIAGVMGAQATLASAIVADTTPPQRRSAALGVLGAAFGLSMIIGPLTGGLVARYWSHAGVGWAGATVQVLSLLTVWLWLRETRAPVAADHPARRPVPLARLLAMPHVTPLLVVTFLMTFALAQFTTTLSGLAAQRYGYTEAQSGYAFALFGLLGVLTQGLGVRALAPRWGERTLALVGLLAMTVGIGMLSAVLPPAALWLSATFIAVGAALNTPALTALVSGCAGDDRQGALLGVHQSATSLGRSIGAALAGWLFGSIGMSAPYVLAVAAGLLGAVLLVTSRPRPMSTPS